VGVFSSELGRSARIGALLRDHNGFVLAVRERRVDDDGVNYSVQWRLVETISPPPEEEAPTQIIPAGFARHAVDAAVADCYRSIEMLAALADAIARQLDA
jgi:hypothetical protein